MCLTISFSVWVIGNPDVHTEPSSEGRADLVQTLAFAVYKLGDLEQMS